MQSVVVTDSTGRTVVSGSEGTAGIFVSAPVAVVTTDVNGYASGTFVSAPVSVVQTDINGNDATPTFWAAPTPIVLVNAAGVDPLSSNFISAPVAMTITNAASIDDFLLEDSSGVLLLEDGTSILLQEV